MATEINKVGKEASQLLSEMKVAKFKVKVTREQNTARLEKLRPLLQQVWDALEAGEEVNGWRTKKDWCANYAETSQRNIQYILKGGNTNRPDAKRFVTLKRGSMFTVDGVVYRIPDEEELGYGSSHIATIYQPRGKKFVKGEWANLTFTGCIIVEDKTANPEPAAKPTPKKKKVKRYSTNVHPGFITMPGKPHRTHKMNGTRTWCGKTLGDTLAADAKMSDKPTCRNCQNGEQRHLDSIEYMKNIYDKTGIGTPKEMHPAAKKMAETLATVYGTDVKEIQAQLSKVAICDEDGIKE